MNIVVVGGGTPGHFGSDFAKRARSEGHTVYVISHSDSYADEHTTVADFTNTASVVSAYKSIVEKTSNDVEILLYNSTADSYPNKVEHFVKHEVDEAAYLQTLRLHSIIPHALALEFNNSGNENSRMIFMASRSGLMLNRWEENEGLGYAGGKAFQARLMIAMARINTKGPIYTAVCPDFGYADPKHYPGVFETVYNHVTTVSWDHNGKIVGIWNPDEINVVERIKLDDLEIY